VLLFIWRLVIYEWTNQNNDSRSHSTVLSQSKHQPDVYIYCNKHTILHGLQVDGQCGNMVHVALVTSIYTC
jgi:hypothetical protein